MSAHLKVFKKNCTSELRTTNGAYLLELLVALFVSGVIAGALTMSISEGMRTTQGSQSQVIATWLAKEAFERVRISAAQSDPQHLWSTTTGALDVPNNTTVDFKLRSTDQTTLAPYDFVQRPLLLDLETLKWVDKNGEESIPIAFDGTATATFNDTDNGGKVVLVKIYWKESTSSGQKTFSLKGAVFPQTNYRNF